MTRFDLSVDGQGWHGTDYGELDGNAGETWTRPDGFRTWREVFATCDPSLGSGEDEGVPVGHHVAVFQAHAAGAVVDPAPLSVEFDLDCAGWQLIDAGVVPAADGGWEERRIARRGCFPWEQWPSIIAALLVARPSRRKS